MNSREIRHRLQKSLRSILKSSRQEIWSARMVASRLKEGGLGETYTDRIDRSF